jgi:hypothetical protein
VTKIINTRHGATRAPLGITPRVSKYREATDTSALREAKAFKIIAFRECFAATASIACHIDVLT